MSARLVTVTPELATLADSVPRGRPARMSRTGAPYG